MSDEGAWYDLRIDIVYVSGVLAAEDLEALVAGQRTALGGRVRGMSVTVSSHNHSVVSIEASVQGSSPLDALTLLDMALTNALLDTGLFDRFDVSRRMLHAGPWEPPTWV